MRPHEFSVTVIFKPYLPSGYSCHGQSRAVGQDNDLHENGYERFVLSQTEGGAIPRSSMHRKPSVERPNDQSILQ